MGAITDIVGQLVHLVGVTLHQVIHTVRVEYTFNAQMMYPATLLCNVLGLVQLEIYIVILLSDRTIV